MEHKVIEHSAATELMEEQIAFDNKCALARISTIDKWKLDRFMAECITKIQKIKGETLRLRFEMLSPNNAVNITWQQANAYIKVSDKAVELQAYTKENDIHCGSFIHLDTIVVIASRDKVAYEKAVIREQED